LRERVSKVRLSIRRTRRATVEKGNAAGQVSLDPSATVPSGVFTQAAARRGLAGHAALYYFCSVGDPKPPLWGRACRPFLSPKYRSTHCKYEYILAQTVL